MVFRNGSMAPFTRESGSTTKLRVKVLSGMPKVTFTLVSSRPTKLMDLVSILMLTAPDTRANGSTTCNRARVRRPGWMVQSTLESTKTE